MRGRILLVLAAAGVVWVVVANTLPAARARTADWSHPATLATSSGIRVVYPRGWTAFATGPRSLVVASFPMPRDWPTRPRKQVPDGGVYLEIFSYGAAWPGYPAGPPPFELRARDHGFFECGFGLEGYRIRFTQDGQAMQAMVALGPGARTADALGVLNRL